MHLIFIIVGLSIPLGYLIFRVVERQFGYRFSKTKIAFFYSFAGMVYALVALLASFLHLYFLQFYIAIPALFTGFLCFYRAKQLRSKSNFKRFVLIVLVLVTIWCCIQLTTVF
tara:strand:- start:1007 stop:1345 length:339 start_codon:yes stop_codon:yes gene_type:complete